MKNGCGWIKMNDRSEKHKSQKEKSETDEKSLPPRKAKNVMLKEEDP